MDMIPQHDIHNVSLLELPYERVLSSYERYLSPYERYL